MMFGFSSYKYLLKEVGQDFFSKYDNLMECPHMCYERGFCMKKTCYCKPGYVGKDCGFDHYDWQKNDQYNADAKKYFIIAGAVSGGLGLIFGI